MKVDLQQFISAYHEAGKFKDNWQEGIKLLPFTSNPSTSNFDKLCALQNTIGEFARLISNYDTSPIIDFESSVVEPVKNYLRQKRMQEEQIDEYVKVVRDVFSVNGNLNIVSPQFFKYIPLVPEDGRISDINKKKYSDGQRKIADYLFSMYEDEPVSFENNGCDNLFLRIVSEALIKSAFSQPHGEKQHGNYTIPPYISKSFTNDLKWLLSQTERIQIRYLHLLLHFYACYSITQSIILISSEKTEMQTMGEPEKLYFILASEKTSMSHEAILYGWANKVQKPKLLERLFGKIQALDIANSILGGNVGFYPKILATLKETPFEENKQTLSKILKLYVEDKSAIIHARKGEEQQSVKDFTPEVGSYEEFLQKLEKCCIDLQSKDYRSKLKQRVRNILSIRFLQMRRGNDVLVIDNEMLIFLIDLMTKGKMMKLEQLYKHFKSYGIIFNSETRTAIEEYLLKLNLLDRKSDSGEVQYVRPVL